jgi:predicted XRE-type DNA-binding protein
MDYHKHYHLLINRAKIRDLDTSVYVEKHHIVPKCLGGLNNIDNIVKLTPREHFIAHQLLVKIYPESPRLVYAAFLMTQSNSKYSRINNRLYGWLKESLSVSIKGKNNPMYGKTHTLKARKKISEATKGRRLCGEKNGMFGKTHTEEAKEKISKTFQEKGHPWSGKKHSEETRTKMSKSAKGRIVSHLTKLKKSDQQKGEKNINSKIREEQVLQIRKLYKLDPNKYSQKNLANLFGIKQAAISKIITRRTWKHVV